MTIISSQDYIAEEIVERKQDELQDIQVVILPIAFAGTFENAEYYILMDCHHTREAAIRMGKKIEYEKHDGQSEYNWATNWTFEETLEENWMGGEWYNIETGEAIF